MHSGFDVIVIGGGHAGCEAAAAASRMGARTALVSSDPGRIGAMSCNPSIGGVGKGHLVRELDVFDGLMGRAADRAAIHYRMLNRSKGAAVHGPRVQADRRLYREAIAQLLALESGVEIIRGHVDRLIVSGGRATGVELEGGEDRLSARAVILATGTFLGGVMFVGAERREGGRTDERAATTLARQLRELSLPMARLKTGTPPRLDGRTIDWARLERQPSDREPWCLSPMSGGRAAPQVACALTRTNSETHAIIGEALHRSPLFSGAIEGRGPRYCPSIEDKIVRFGERDGHQVFLEPEGLNDHLIYPNGISTSLPLDVQQRFVRSIAGLERTEIVQAGYAVEYDYVDPRALDSTLALRALPGLYCAGQINGTTGYEEAAAQGLVAGLNAAASALGKEPVRFNRSDSYIGVLIDDLTLQGITEPYRMLTARAEHRLHLRADNASTRLGKKALDIGAVGNARRDYLRRHLEAHKAGSTLMATPRQIDGRGPKRSLAEWIRQEDLEADLLALEPALAEIGPVLEELVADAHYEPYVERQAAEAARIAADAHVDTSGLENYSAVGGLSKEMIEKLEAVRPETLAAASRIRGITPAALTAILIAARRVA